MAQVYLRQFRLDDAPLMLEWMLDPELAENFRFTTQNADLEKAAVFIKRSWEEQQLNLHLAIANQENDEYLGSISLKNIDAENRNAEYAIALRKKCIGTGVAQEATKLILDQAFRELRLHRVYLNVLAENVRARRFYEKFGFEYEGVFKGHTWLRGKWHDLAWYAIVNKQES